MTKTIPYNTYGTVTTRASVTIPASNVPYTYEPLKSDLYIASDLTDVAPKPVITNMVYYARNNIPNYSSITSIPSGYLPTDINTSTAKDWYGAFDYCINLTSLSDPFYNTSNASNMSNMFNSCSNLTTIPNFDTGNVTDMDSMFYSCYNLTTVPNFDTSNVTNMYGMFYSCYNLTTVPNFDTSNVTNMCGMLANCYNLTTVPNFDTSNVTAVSNWRTGSIFSDCHNLTNVPKLDFSKVTDAGDLFDNCYRLQDIPNFTFDTNCVNFFHFAHNCHNIQNIPIINFPEQANLCAMYSNCYNLRGNLYVTANNIVNASRLFGTVFEDMNYIKNIYCHANTNTYNIIYTAMNNNNTYNSNWNAYLKTFGSEPIPLLKIADAFDENGKQDTVNYVFRTPLSNINLYIDFNNGYQTYISDIANVTPYQDLNISVQFNIPNTPDSDLVLPTPLGLKIINRDTNEEIYNSFNDLTGTRFTTYNVNYYLGI